MDSDVFGHILVRNNSKLDQQGFQEVRTGRGSILTEYEPVGAHGGPIHEGVFSESGYFVVQNILQNIRCSWAGDRPAPEIEHSVEYSAAYLISRGGGATGLGKSNIP